LARRTGIGIAKFALPSFILMKGDLMVFGASKVKRAGAAALLGVFALTQVVAGQETTEYQAPDNIDEISGSISTDGSSTVGPLTAAVAEEFRGVTENIDVTVDISGTGGGFERFCGGETDISNASRAIEQDEIDVCAENGVDFYEFEVALDGITVVVNSANDFVTCLTTDQLNQLWAPESDITTWNQLNPDWPEEPVSLYGPGADSGTFDYFTDVINGEEGASRTDYQPSEDDNVIVQGVANDNFALGYFGFAYYLENEGTLKAVEVDNGDGCVAPSQETIADGSYAPLSRPLFLYVSDAALERPEVQEFVRFYLASASGLATDVGYIGIPDEVMAEQQQKLEGAIDGSIAPDSQGGSGTPEATPAA
jgi:phosphate transport system substrate-binding protein